MTHRDTSAASARGTSKLLLGVVVASLSSVVWAQPAPTPEAARALVARVAEALGGADRVRAVRNITLSGDGQMAWNIGGEEISGSPHAPLKYQELADLRRVYDIEHDRYQARERGWQLFPFLAANSYTFSLVDRRLDGDIAFDTAFPVVQGANVANSTEPRRIAANVW